MNRSKGNPLLLVLLVPLILAALCALGLLSSSGSFMAPMAHQTQMAGYGYGEGAGIPPGGGSCANIGVYEPLNPFVGWPVDFHPNNWNTITSWYCDPTYFPGFTHWGLDFGRLDWSAGNAIDGIPAWNTAERARVVQAVFCSPNPCWNYGMGNFVQLEALRPEEQCLPVPDREPECIIVWIPTGWKATYMHLQDLSVAKDDEIERWTVIGHVDNTGNSSGPHLHYQINDPDGKPIDPAPAVSKSTYSDALRALWKGLRP